MNEEFKTIKFETSLIWDDHTLPGGYLNLQGVPFTMEKDEDGALLGMEIWPTERNELRSRDVYVSVANASEVYFLINAAFGLRVNPRTKDEWEGREIGSIRLTDDNGETFQCRLVLGKNIRDWFPLNFPNSVFKLTDSCASNVWSSPQTGASIDMLKLKLPDDFNLARVSIQARLESTHPIEPARLSEVRAELVRTVSPAIGEAEPEVEYSAELAREQIEVSYPRIRVYGMTCRIGEAKRIYSNLETSGGPCDFTFPAIGAALPLSFFDCSTDRVSMKQEVTDED